MPTPNTAPVLQPVLYVDDEPDNLELFQIQFQGDVEVVTATSADEALRILERRPIGLILADERMPGTTAFILGAGVQRWPDTSESRLRVSDRPLVPRSLRARTILLA